ncbi:CLUMA_CG018938, isoform A [Clunio marinus]|uniref:CLUMA_CG018938, isoform A n=1 Tax=Clunio marinus TaxID=568069 RepID=A0A1J1J159_9DIPT|nr:CLUMA_CG018938, isoform A [Clunio marinus]
MDDQKARRRKILQKYVENKSKPLSMFAKEMDFPLTTVRRVIKSFIDSGTVDRKAGSGRKKGTGDKTLAQKLNQALLTNPNRTLRDLASEFQTSHTNVRKIKKKLDYDKRKVKKKPNRTDNQNVNAKSRASRLRKKIEIKNKK